MQGSGQDLPLTDGAWARWALSMLAAWGKTLLASAKHERNGLIEAEALRVVLQTLGAQLNTDLAKVVLCSR